MKNWKKWALAFGLIAAVMVVVPEVAQAQDSSCSWVDAGSGFGGWYDANGEPCTPKMESGGDMSTGEYQAWLTLSWWTFVYVWFIITGVPL